MVCFASGAVKMSQFRDFPGDAVVKSLPDNLGVSGSITATGTGIPHAVGQLSPGSTTREATALRSPCTAVKSSPHLL